MSDFTDAYRPDLSEEEKAALYAAHAKLGPEDCTEDFHVTLPLHVDQQEAPVAHIRVCQCALAGTGRCCGSAASALITRGSTEGLSDGTYFLGGRL